MAFSAAGSPPPQPPPHNGRNLDLNSMRVIDMSLYSQAELYALSLQSNFGYDPRRYDDIVIPKIDRSVFNESEGSRKQTYSRVRLPPRKPISSTASNPHTSQFRDDPERAEDLRIIKLMKDLMNGNESVPDPADFNDSVPRPPNVVNAEMKRPRGRPRKNESRLPVVAPPVVRVVETPKVDKNDAAKGDFVVDANIVNMDRNILNRDGKAVNLEDLGNLEDPYGPELGRRTVGLATDDELLAFLKGFNGQWASRRKKKRIIEASEFGDMLPKGWKLVLAIKRKGGHVWLFCRRYISPSGRQFVLCKDISSYLCYILSLPSSSEETPSTLMINPQMRTSAEDGDRVVQENKNCETSVVTNILNNNVAQATAMDVNTQEAQPAEIFNCDKCAVTFDRKDDLLQHQLSSHRRKRCRFEESVTDGVIIKSGKFECQYCHKTFNERNLYNGHMGAHIKHEPKSGDALPACLLDQNEDDPNTLPSSGIISEFTVQELTEEDVIHIADTNAKIDEMSISVEGELINGSCAIEPINVLSREEQGFDCDNSEGNLADELHNKQEDNKASEVSIGIEIEEVITESFTLPDSANEKIYDFSTFGGKGSKVPNQEAGSRDIASHGNDGTSITRNVEDEIENLITEADNQVKFCIASPPGGEGSKVPNQDTGFLDIASHLNDDSSNTKNDVDDKIENLITAADKQVKSYRASPSGGEGSKMPNQEAGFHDIASQRNYDTSSTTNVVEDEAENLISEADKQVNLTIHGLSSHLVGSDLNPADQSDKQSSLDGGSIASATVNQFSNHANTGNVSYFTSESEGLKESRECGGYDVESSANIHNVKPMADFGIGDAENQVEAVVTKCAKSPVTNLFDSSLKVDEQVVGDNRNNADALFAVQESGPSNYLENNLPFLPSYKQTFDSTNEQTEVVFGINHDEQRMQERNMEYCSLVSSDQNIFQNKDNLAQQDIVFDTGLFGRAAEQTSINNNVNAMRLDDVCKSSNSELMLSFGNNDNAEMATNYMRDFSVGQAFNSENDLGTVVEQKHENCLLGLIAHDHQACDTGNNLNSMYKHGIWEEPGNDVGHGKLMMGFGSSSSSSHMQQSHDDGHEKLMMGFGSSSSSHMQQSHDDGHEKLMMGFGSSSSSHMQQSHDDGHDKLIMGFGSSNSSHVQQSHHHDLAAGGFWRTGILADSSSSQKQQCSSFFPTFSTFPDKVENESPLELNMSHERMRGSLALNMSHERMRGGFEVPEPARAEQVEFSFLTNHQNLNSLPPDESSKTLAPYFGSGEQSFNNPPPFWLEKDTLSLNITAPNMVSTMCMWCRNQFQYNPNQLTMQAGMMGSSVCPTCSARISEQFL